MNLAGILTASADLFGANTALKLDERELTYWALDLASARLAGLLMARGVEAGQRVGVLLPNVPEYAVAYYGVLRAGAVVVPIGVMPGREDLALQLRDTESRLLLAWHGVAETADAAAGEAGADCLFVTPGEFEKLLLSAPPAHEPCERAPSDTAAVLYTSELTHGGLAADARDAIARHGLTDSDVMLTARPLCDASTLNATVGAGACLTLMPNFDAARALDVVARDRVTLFQGTPEMVSALRLRMPSGSALRASYS